MMKPYPFVRPYYYLSLVKDLVDFIQAPQLIQNETKSTKEKVYDAIGLLLIKLVFSVTVALVLGAFYEPENLTDAAMSERFTPVVYLMVGGIILPLFEEVCFRLSLRFNPVYLGLSGGALGYYLVTKGFFRTKLSLVDETFWLRVCIAIGVGLLVFLMTRNAGIKKRLAQFWSEHFRWIYYISCLSFAWLHIFNFKMQLMTLILLPVITLPQLFSASIAGYLRTAFGFRYPMVMHMATNLLFISLSFLPLD